MMAFTSSEFTMLSILLQNIPDAVGSMMTLFTKHKILVLLMNQIHNKLTDTSNVTVAYVVNYSLSDSVGLKKVFIWCQIRSNLGAHAHILLIYLWNNLPHWKAGRHFCCDVVTWSHDSEVIWEAESRRFCKRWLALQK